MARYPKATWRPVERYEPGGPVCVSMVRYDVAVVHIEDGEWSRDEAFRWYNTSGHAIPHFRLHTPTAQIDQYVDTKYRASACLEGNHRCLAIETWGRGNGDNADPLPDKAAEALAEWLAWCCTEHDIPAQVMRNSKPESRGLAHHRLGIDGNFPDPPGGPLGGRVAGGEKWSGSFGKTCPTSPRITQLQKEIYPTAIALAKGKNVPLEDDMQLNDLVIDREKDADDVTVREVLRTVYQYTQRSAKREQAMLAALTKLPDAVVQALPQTLGGDLTEADVRQACQAAMRNLLGGLDE